MGEGLLVGEEVTSSQLSSLSTDRVLLQSVFLNIYSSWDADPHANRTELCTDGWEEPLDS